MAFRVRYRRFGTALFSALALALACLWPLSAMAQANFEAVQLGGRTAMMGGAAVATGEDQATAFINPAGITNIPGQSLSFSTFAASFKNRTMHASEEVSDSLGLPDKQVGNLKLRVLPNTFCLFLDGPPKDAYSGRSRHKYAMCMATTEREEFDIAKNANDVSGTDWEGASKSTSMEFVRSTAAIAWGLQLNRNTSIGVTQRVDNARLHDRTIATSFQAEGAEGRMQTLGQSIAAWSWDSSIVLGLTSNISRRLTLGVSLTTPSQHLAGKYTGSSSVASTEDQPHSVTQDNGDFRYNHPGSIRMGLAFTWPRLIFEVDGSFYGPQKNLALANFDRTTVLAERGEQPGDPAILSESTERGSLSERGAPVTNLSLGAEFFIENNFSLVTGIQTDFSGIQPRETSAPSEVLFRQNKDTVHAALGVTSYGENGRLLMGVRGNYSSGKILLADATKTTPEFVALDQSEWGLSLVISGTISFRSVADTAVRATSPFTQRLDDNSEEDGETKKAKKRGEDE